MAKNKDQSDSQPAADSVLEARVHDMMDVEVQPASVVMPEKATTKDLPPLDIFTATTPGAPAVAAELVSEPATKPTTEELVAEPIELLQVEPASTEISIPILQLDTDDSDAAIADIVAQEADAVLAAEDAGLAQAAEDVEPVEEPERHGHPIFWFFIVLLVIIAIVTTVVLVRPDLVPFSA